MRKEEEMVEFEDWIVYAPNATGIVYTVFDVITGGAPIFKRFRGWDIHRLPPGYRAEPAGTTPFAEGLKIGCADWKEESVKALSKD